MLEAERMLHLRRYLTLIVRAQLHSSRCQTARNPPSRHGGYVVGYVHSHHAGLRPEIHVASCGRMYGTMVPQSSQSDAIDHKLMLFCDDVKKGRVSADALREIIDLCSKNDYQLPQDTGILLLKCCGNLLPDLKAAERNNLTDQVWHLAKKSGGALTLEYYNTLLGINEENSKFVNPKKFLAKMSVEPDENTYRLLLNAATKADDSKYLWDILSTIKEKNITIYEEAVNALVQISVTNGNIAEIEQTIALLQEAKLSTAKAYTELACGYARLGDIPNLIKILNEEPQSNANLLRIVKVLSMSNNSRHIPVVLNFLLTSVPEIEPEISRIIAELIRVDRVTDAHIIINCFAMNNVTKSIMQNFVNSFMNELIISDAPIYDIIKYANEFVDSGYSQCALTNIAEIGLKLGREKLCLAVFQAMRDKNIEIRPHYYWPLLLKAYHETGEAKIFSIVKSMVNEGVDIDFDTLSNYVFPCVNTADPIVTLQKLLMNDVPEDVSCTPLLCFLLHKNRLQDVALVCKYFKHSKVYYKELMKPLVRAYFFTKDVENCVLLLTAFPQGPEFVGIFLKTILKDENPIYIEDLQLLLEELKKSKTKISQEDAIILKNNLEQNKNFNVTTKMANLIDEVIDPDMKNSNITSFILHPKYMNTKELTSYLIELKSNKLSTANMLHKLLMLYCSENNLKKAEKIRQEYDACKYEWTPGMKLILFELYLKHNKLYEAETLLSTFQSNELQIDKNKIVIYATALVKAGQFTKAFDVIEKFKSTDTKVDVQSQCCALLETIAQSQYHANINDMLNLLLKKKYCQIDVDLLKPLVAIPLELNDILGAMDVFTECAHKYRKAPLALEIMKVLLKQKYNSELHNANNYIEQVYNITTTAYSVKVANTLLAIALATLNKTEKLQTLLQTHELSMRCLIYYIKHAKTNSNIDGLLNLFIVANENHLNQDLMCMSFLSVYNKMGDCKRALNLWKIMCTKNIKPSKLFEKNFTQFLLANKVPLPELDRIKEK